MKKEKFVYNNKTKRYEKIFEPLSNLFNLPVPFIISAIVVSGIIFSILLTTDVVVSIPFLNTIITPSKKQLSEQTINAIDSLLNNYNANSNSIEERNLNLTLDSLKSEIHLYQAILNDERSINEGLKSKMYEIEKNYISREKALYSLDHQIKEKEYVLSAIREEINNELKKRATINPPDVESRLKLHLKKYYPYYLAGGGIVILLSFIFRKKIKKWYEKNFIKLMGSYVPKYAMTFDLPNESRAPVQQYIIFFKEFVRVSKGYDVEFIVEHIEQGIKIEFRGQKSEWEDKIKDWFQEYMGLIRSNLEEIKIKYTVDVDDVRKDILLTKMENEVSHLKNALKIAHLENKYLAEKYEDVKELSLILADKNIIVSSQYIEGGNQQYADKIENK